MSENLIGPVLIVPMSVEKCLGAIGLAVREYAKVRGHGRYELKTIVRYEGGEGAYMEMFEIIPLADGQ